MGRKVAASTTIATCSNKTRSKVFCTLKDLTNLIQEFARCKNFPPLYTIGPEIFPSKGSLSPSPALAFFRFSGRGTHSRQF
jgi:hypothetical protein